MSSKSKTTILKSLHRNESTSNTNPTVNRGWIRMLRVGKQSLLHTWHPSCYCRYTPGDKSWMRKEGDCDYDKYSFSIIFQLWQTRCCPLPFFLCPFVLIPLTVVLSVLFRYTDSDYPFSIFKLFLNVLEKHSLYLYIPLCIPSLIRSEYH